MKLDQLLIKHEVGSSEKNMIQLVNIQNHSKMLHNKLNQSIRYIDSNVIVATK